MLTWGVAAGCHAAHGMQGAGATGEDTVHKRTGIRHCTVLYCTVLYSTVLYCIVLYCTVCLDVWPGWGKTVQRGARMGIFQQQNCAQGWELIKIFHTVKLFYFNSTTVAGAAIISIQWRNGLKMSLKQVNCWLKFNFIW